MLRPFGQSPEVGHASQRRTALTRLHRIGSHWCWSVLGDTDDKDEPNDKT